MDKLRQLFKKVFSKKEVGKFEENKISDNSIWFPIWEDPDLIEKIKSSIYIANPKSLHQELKVNLQVVEYTTAYDEDLSSKIPLISVAEIMKKFKPVTPQEIFDIPAGNDFPPKIVKIENPIAVISDAETDYETDINVIDRNRLAEADRLKSLMQAIKIGNSSRKILETKMQELHATIYDIFQKNPEIEKDALYEKSQNKKAKPIEFLGNKYILLASHFGQMEIVPNSRHIRGGIILPIFVPVNALDSLPSNMFLGRILGVVYFNTKPILKNLGPGPVLIAAAISIQMQRSGSK